MVNGLVTKRARSREPERLLEWAYREFNNYSLFRAGEKVGEAPVWLGKLSHVPLVIKNNVTLTIPRKNRRKMQVKLIYEGPIPSPVKKGDMVGKVVVTLPSEPKIVVPVLAGAAVEQLGLFGRLWAAVTTILFGDTRS